MDCLQVSLLVPCVFMLRVTRCYKILQHLSLQWHLGGWVACWIALEICP